MSTDRSGSVVKERRARCAVCAGARLEVAIELPKLPLTGIYSRSAVRDDLGGIDQALVICSDCSHAQLAERVTTSVLYGESYSFRTSASSTARAGTATFLAALEEFAPGRRFECAVDLGCNDLYLLNQLRDRARARVGIDPVLAGSEHAGAGDGIRAVGAAVEDVDLREVAGCSPDLIVCRHTFEHIDDPQAVLQQLVDVAAEDALFMFEVPGFEALVERLRFDQVFHQHLQYFSLRSFQRLLEGAGAVYRGHRENYHDWGAMIVAFAKRSGPPGAAAPAPRVADASGIRRRYAVFRQHLAAVNEALQSLDGTLYGYGAAQMLPVLAYHLQCDLSTLRAVLDDDPVKDGLHYANLPLVIRRADTVADLEQASVVITAVDSVVPILARLSSRRPRHLIYPLPVI